MGYTIDDFADRWTSTIQIRSYRKFYAFVV